MTLGAPFGHGPRRLHAALVWGLLVCLLLTGLSGAVTQVLGPRHVHQAPSATTTAPQFLNWLRQVPLLAELRALREQAHAQAHANSHAQGAAHDHLARHHHAPFDASVVALDSSTPDGGGAEEATGTPLMPALLGGLSLPLLDGLSQAWHRALPGAFRSAAPAREERPPRR